MSSEIRTGAVSFVPVRVSQSTRPDQQVRVIAQGICRLCVYPLHALCRIAVARDGPVGKPGINIGKVRFR